MGPGPLAPTSDILVSARGNVVLVLQEKLESSSKINKDKHRWTL